MISLFAYPVGEVRLRRELQRRVHKGRALHRRRRPTATQVREWKQLQDLHPHLRQSGSLLATQTWPGTLAPSRWWQ